MWETYREIDSNRREGGRESDIDVGDIQGNR